MNEYKITDKWINPGGKFLLDGHDEFGDYRCLANKDIKDVVTKEQFNQMKYIVGDESNE